MDQYQESDIHLRRLKLEQDKKTFFIKKRELEAAEKNSHFAKIISIVSISIAVLSLLVSIIK